MVRINVSREGILTVDGKTIPVDPIVMLVMLAIFNPSLDSINMSADEILKLAGEDDDE